MKTKYEMTTKQPHTPGPWTRGFGNWVYRGTRGDLGRLVAMCEPMEKTKAGWEECFSNAQLVAAAPELLVALKELRAQLRAHVKLDVKKHYSLMVADAAAGTAIAKAEGTLP